MNDLITLSKLDLRVPRWDIDRLIPRHCPICNSEGNAEYVRPDGLVIRYCSKCGTFFVSPSPSEDLLKEFYKKYFVLHFGRGANFDKKSAKDYSLLNPQSDLRIRELLSIMNPEQRSVLDVGCGTGITLFGLRKLGARVEGIDLDTDAVNFVNNELAIKCNYGSVADLEGEFDIIILFDFIEHPLDPLPTLIKCKRMLRPNGLILIWTPNSTFAHIDNEPILFRVDLEHMQYLSLKTCNYLADLLDLDIVHLESIGYPSLDGITQCDSKQEKINIIKNIVVHTPVIGAMSKFLYQIANQNANSLDERLGRYHLFCILQNKSLE
ncbi:MAG: class I SAM-dependent methyltransferase [Methanothrix sp.]|nr:MAG: class I SAM-dependent methyltransferase [Methanothrix sp.]